MPKKVTIPKCSAEDRITLETWANSRTLEARLVERAKIMIKCLEEESVKNIAADLKIRPNTVIDWRRRFEKKGIAGLYDLPRSGKPPRYDEEFRKQVLDDLEKPPPAGQATWDGPTVAEHLNASVHAVWRVLRKEGAYSTDSGQ
ncbi:MAG: helix-turn-helix domain containing protein [Armatimonadetes bacterium]|nr:helix-turn-helix domain containing protein [Armatimonadota bacterium]